MVVLKGVPQLILREPALCEGDSRAGARKVDRQTGNIRSVTELEPHLPGCASGLEPGCPGGISSKARVTAEEVTNSG